MADSDSERDIIDEIDLGAVSNPQRDRELAQDTDARSNTPVEDITNPQIHYGPKQRLGVVIRRRHFDHRLIDHGHSLGRGFGPALPRGPAKHAAKAQHQAHNHGTAVFLPPLL